LDHPADRENPTTASTPTEVRLGYARVSTHAQEIQSQVDAREARGMHRLRHDRISTRVREHPQRKAAPEYRSHAAKATLVVHETKQLGRGASTAQRHTHLITRHIRLDEPH
jgi:DNA invertase Pin-like site-specific DNA recombinase